MSDLDSVTRLLTETALELERLDPELVLGNVELLDALGNVGEAHDHLWHRLTTGDSQEARARLVDLAGELGRARELSQALRALDVVHGRLACSGMLAEDDEVESVGGCW